VSLVSSPTVVDYAPLQLAAKIKVPSDLDGAFERNANFLFIECKQLHRQDMSFGQRFLLEKLARQPFSTVILVMLSGKRTEAGSLLFDPIAYMKFGKGQEYKWKPTDLWKFIDMYRTWEAVATVNPGIASWIEEMPEIPFYFSAE